MSEPRDGLRARDEFVEDHLLRHLPIYINGPLWRCLCTANGDSQPGFGADGWRKHVGLSIGHPAAIDAPVNSLAASDTGAEEGPRRRLWCEQNESSASAHGHTRECYTDD